MKGELAQGLGGLADPKRGPASATRRPRSVVGHKTSARRYTEDQLRFDLQPTAYQLAARALGLGGVGLRFQVITEKRQRSPDAFLDAHQP